MTIEEIEQLIDDRDGRIILYLDPPKADCDIRGVVIDLIARVKGLEDGISKIGAIIMFESSGHRIAKIEKIIDKLIDWDDDLCKRLEKEVL